MAHGSVIGSGRPVNRGCGNSPWSCRRMRFRRGTTVCLGSRADLRPARKNWTGHLSNHARMPRHASRPALPMPPTLRRGRSWCRWASGRRRWGWAAPDGPPARARRHPRSSAGAAALPVHLLL